MSTVVKRVFADDQCKRCGLNFLDRLLHSPDTHEAGILLLNSVITDARFTEGSDAYGVTLIEWVLKQPRAQAEFKDLIKRMLQAEQVRAELVSVLEYIASHESTETQIAELLLTVLQREDIHSNLQEMLIQSVEHALAQ